MARLPGPAERRLRFASVLESRFAEGRFPCPHCLQVARPEDVQGAVAGMLEGAGVPFPMPATSRKYDLIAVVCAGCGEDTLFIRRWQFKIPGADVGDPEQVTEWIQQVLPIGRSPRKFPNSPKGPKEDYHAACKVLEVSPEASACMSRRALQSILREQGYDQKDLAPQVDALLAETDPRQLLPPALHEQVDAIRAFGNFGAHVQRDKSTLEIIPVEPGEAEWCIKIVEALLDHYYEAPAIARAKIDAANLKFGKAGKPSMKGPPASP